MDSKFFMNTRDQLAQGYDEITGWDPPTFQHILDQFHQPLYRYYAVHTGGELTQAQRMTAETLSIVYRQPATLAKKNFPSWIFGIAWDVLNAHMSRGIAASNVDVPADDPALITRTLRTLRSVAFYAREALCLRFFAELDLQDIVLMMDKSEVAIKGLVYQGVREFACRMNNAEFVKLPCKQLLALAQEYHLYLSSLHAGDSPLRNVPTDIVQATHHLKTLRSALSMKPESRLQLTSQMQQILRAGNSSATRL